MRVLIVKTTSLGDIIHTLPALTDAQNALPELIPIYLDVITNPDKTKKKSTKELEERIIKLL